MTEADFFLPRGVSSSEEITIGFLELAAGAREDATDFPSRRARFLCGMDW